MFPGPSCKQTIWAAKDLKSSSNNRGGGVIVINWQHNGLILLYLALAGLSLTQILSVRCDNVRLHGTLIINPILAATIWLYETALNGVWISRDAQNNVSHLYVNIFGGSVSWNVSDSWKA